MQRMCLYLSGLFLLAAALQAQDNERFYQLVNDAKSRISEIGVDELRAMLDANTPPVVLDVREAAEYREGHLKGAKHLSKGVLEWQIVHHVPDVDTPIVLYCGGGNRSALSADNLQKMGYTRVFSVKGGMWAIEEADLPLETAPAAEEKP